MSIEAAPMPDDAIGKSQASPRAPNHSAPSTPRIFHRYCAGSGRH